MRVARFLSELRRQVQKPLFVIWDRSLTHRAEVVNRIFARSSRLHRFFLPPYAPEINPVEMVWGHLKSNPLANYTPNNPKDLSQTARYHVSRLRRRKHLLRSFLYATPLFHT